MPITLDTTISGTTANSYATLAELASYVERRPQLQAAHAALTDEQRTAYLAWAADVMNAWDWRGVRTTEAQRLAHPRYGIMKSASIVGAYDRWPHTAIYTYPSDTIIQAVKDLQCELALALYIGTYQPDEDSRIVEKHMDGLVIKREFTGQQPGALPPSIKNLVRDLLNISQRVRG